MTQTIPCQHCEDGTVELIDMKGRCPKCKAHHTIQLRVPLGGVKL